MTTRSVQKQKQTEVSERNTYSLLGHVALLDAFLDAIAVRLVGGVAGGVVLLLDHLGGLVVLKENY